MQNHVSLTNLSLFLRRQYKDMIRLNNLWLSGIGILRLLKRRRYIFSVLFTIFEIQSKLDSDDIQMNDGGLLTKPKWNFLDIQSLGYISHKTFHQPLSVMEFNYLLLNYNMYFRLITENTLLLSSAMSFFLFISGTPVKLAKKSSNPSKGCSP